MGIEVLTLVRHGQSEYNQHRANLIKSELYSRFLSGLSNQNRNEAEIDTLARELTETNKAFERTSEISLSEVGRQQALATGNKLKQLIEVPDIIFLSPYRRALETLECFRISWPEMKSVDTITDDRLREQDHGTFLKYGDWKVFCHYYPEQELSRRQIGRYDYRFPEGESIANVAMRAHTFLDDIQKRFEGGKVLVLSHEITILSIRGKIDLDGPEEIMARYRERKVFNCSVTVYRDDKVTNLDNSKLY